VLDAADSAMHRLYEQLAKAAKAGGEEAELRRECIALQRYRRHWYHGGRHSVAGGEAPNEERDHHRAQWCEARALLGDRSNIVVDNVVLSEQSLKVAGYAIGYESADRARAAAHDILRQAGQDLAKLWRERPE
jgi:hypothetical protein